MLCNSTLLISKNRKARDQKFGMNEAGSLRFKKFIAVDILNMSEKFAGIKSIRSK